MKTRKWLLNGFMVTVLVICLSFGTAHALPGDFPDLSGWVNTWFKIALTETFFHYSNVGVKPNPSYAQTVSMGKAYLRITGWDGTNHILTANIYAKDPNTGQWVTTPFATIDILYFAGTDLQFRGSAQLAASGFTMNLIFVFTGQKNKAGSFVLGGITKLSTMASNMMEIDDVPGSTERWIGSVKISGPMVPASSVPFVPTT